MPTALITGATAGIGAAFVRQLAGERRDLVLVARNADRLQEVAETARQRGVEVEVLPADLADDEGCAAVEARLADRSRPIDLLVNNAGIGLAHPFLHNSITDEERMLRLNVRAVLRLTHAVLPSMMERCAGDVLNVSSVAGFGPVAPGGTYAATKAWVTNFTESLYAAVKDSGVRVTALCPGYVRTEFHERAGIDVGSRSGLLWLDADEVVRVGLMDLRRGRAVSVPSPQYKVVGGLVRHLPRPLLRAVVARRSR